jgi:hypothetical protein
MREREREMTEKRIVVSKNLAKKLARKVRRLDRRREAASRVRNERFEVRERLMEKARKRIRKNDVATVLTNSGIVTRLREDVPSYDGFEIVESDGSAVLLRRMLKEEEEEELVLKCSIGDENLLVTIGPFIRALVRLNTKIDPRRIRVVVDYNVMNDKKRDDEQILRLRRNVVHRIVRNSMGSALLLDLVVLVPKWLWSRGRDIMSEEDIRKEKRDSYPSVHVLCRENYCFDKTTGFQPKTISSKTCRYGGIVIPSNTLNSFDPKRMHLDIDIKSRTTTFQMTPMLFQLQQKSFMTTRTTTSSSMLIKHVVCVEKEPNLHRVVNLFNVYDRLSNLVLCTHDKFVKRYREVVSSDMKVYREEKEKVLPLVLSINQAFEYIENVRKLGHEIVAFDLHEKALTLKPSSSLSSLLKNIMNITATTTTTAALCWGFESSGIPSKWIKSKDTRLQIQSRSSLNLASAISIALHANTPTTT